MNYQTTIDEREAVMRAIAERGAQVAPQYGRRPFRFEDLDGRPEPKSWGPIYTKPVKAKRPFNDETNIPTNCASGQKRCFDAAKHRAKIRAEFAALANAERLAWALGKAKNCQGQTIAQAYAQAMAAKRNAAAVQAWDATRAAA